MCFVPESSVGIKDDPFYHLKNYYLKLWGQRDRIMFLCYIIFIFKLLGFVARTVFIAKSMNNNEVILEISAIYPIPLLAVVKMAFLLIYRKQVHFLFETVATKFWHIDLGGMVLHNYWRKRFFLINCLLLTHFVTSSLYVFLHLAFPDGSIPEGRTKWLPTLVSLPFNPDPSPLYQIMFFLLTWNMFISVFGNGFFDFFFVYAAQHLCAQFMVLKMVLKKLEFGVMEHCDDVDKFNSGRFQEEVYGRLAVCIKHHTLLLRYGNELKNLSSIIFGVQLLTTLLTLVLMGYTLSENLEELAKSTMLLSFVFSSIMQFTIFAVQSADIHDQKFKKSASVAEAAYQCNWHLFNAKAKRGLTLLIMNSQKGISMYGAGLVAMDNEVIVKMAQKVFSFITLLRSLDEQRSVNK